MAAVHELEQIYDMLKRNRTRLTPQRQAILEFLKNTCSHPSAEEIYNHIKRQFRGVSLGTVYNTLHMLKDLGLIQELAYGDLCSRYDGNPEGHYHICCEKCGKVVDFHRPLIHEVEKEAAEVSAFKITNHRLELYGVCQECQ